MISAEQMLKKIEHFLEGTSLKSLMSSSKKISAEYRLLGSTAEKMKENEVLAYIATRMPATCAALLKVFEEVKQRMRSFNPLSLMDVGSGPGTTLWAAAESFPSLKEVHCVEKDAQFLSIAKRLSEELWLYSHVRWMHADMRKTLPQQSCDVVIASYSLGEVPETERMDVLDALWPLAGQVLIAIEPGTPKGFETLRTMRKHLLQAGAHLIGPCPHAGVCPMTDGDWCHFYARLNRSSIHRKAKEATRNYEDEKFSYLAFSRNPVNAYPARIVRHPRKGQGHVRLTICTEEGIKEVVATKRHNDLYRLAKKSEWGDVLSMEENLSKET